MCPLSHQRFAAYNSEPIQRTKVIHERHHLA